MLTVVFQVNLGQWVTLKPPSPHALELNRHRFLQASKTGKSDKRQCIISQVVVWPRGNGISCINEVTLHRTQLVLRRVTICGYAVLVCNQPLGPTHPPTLSGTGNEYLPRDSGSGL